MPIDHEWERWRGLTEQRIEDQCDRLEDLERWRRAHEDFSKMAEGKLMGMMSELNVRIVKVETRLALVAAVAALVGAAVGGVLERMVTAVLP